MQRPCVSCFLRASTIYLAVAAVPALAAGGGVAAAARVSAAANGTSAAAETQTAAAASVPSTQLFARYRTFIGSDADTRSLIQGLRYGETITLGAAESGGATASFTPPTRPMGWGSVNRALSLTQSELASAGIVQPTSAQLATALTGGTLVAADGSPTAVQGVLTLRGQGMGWGEIAHVLGIGPGAATASAASSTKLGASLAGPQHETTPPKRVHVSLPVRRASAGAADDVDNGAIVTAGGSVAGDAGAAAGGRFGAGNRRAMLGAGARLGAGAGTPAPVSVQGGIEAGSMAEFGGGRPFGAAIGAGFGATGGLGLGGR